MKISNSLFSTLRWRLLLSYLAIMTAIFASSKMVVYHFVVNNLYHQFDRELLTLADAAAHTLEPIIEKHGVVYGEFEDEDVEIVSAERQHFVPSEDLDGDLDLPWQDLRQPQQGIEWFNEEGKLLAREGRHLLEEVPLAIAIPSSGNAEMVGAEIRAFSLPVERVVGDDELELKGYVRISEPTEEVETVIGHLRWGLFFGGAIAGALTAVGGMWLTKQSVRPVEYSFDRLQQFTGDASHELRGPLTAIKTSVDVMLTHPERIHPTDAKKFEGIASALKQMTGLVEDLLILARTDTNDKTPSAAWVSIPLEELLEDLADFLLPEAEAKGITLKCNLIAEVFVKGDGLLLKRLFANLLENALHYTPSGGSVTVSLERQEKFAAVYVEDTGIGIAAEHLPLVFDRLWRADKARSRREGGSGLGLAIAKGIAERHQGQISVTSELGVGTCFLVLLPLTSD